MQQDILQLKKDDAIKAYNEGTDADRRLLANLYGRKTFAKDPLEWITNFAAVCEATGANPQDFEIPKDATPKQKHRIYTDKIELVFEAINAGWTPDFHNSDQPKHFGLFEFNKRTGAFALYYVYYYYGYSYVGARLLAESDAKYRHICKHFMQEMNDYLLS